MAGRSVVVVVVVVSSVVRTVTLGVGGFVYLTDLATNLSSRGAGVCGVVTLRGLGVWNNGRSPLRQLGGRSANSGLALIGSSVVVVVVVVVGVVVVVDGAELTRI